ncbi:MAG: lysine--tRNA ligase [Candidatus Magasanikbacteria bacterium]
MEKESTNIHDERIIRIEKLNELKAMDINPYPARCRRTHTLAQARDIGEGEQAVIVGRIMTKRTMGKIIFCHLQDESGRLQVVIKSDVIDTDSFTLFEKKIDSADIISVEGERFTTQKGEPSILAKKWFLLSKSLLPLPDKFHGLSDEETRYRKRYLDFLVNVEQREKIVVRSKILRFIRTFLEEKGFVEVETPVLETIASGAMARTFDTHLNAYDLDVHLRICMGELWQKRLLVGGFEKTFEMGRAFRNEGVDHQHNPEFTMLEYYWAYADYEDNMKLHEEMIPYIIDKAIGKLEVEVDGHLINFKPPYPRVTFHDAVLEHSGIDIDAYEDPKELREVMVKKGYDPENITERGKLLDNLYKQSARPKIIQPTFVLNYPVELKPLAKLSLNPHYTEMFQLIVNGFELSNSYTELNDPLDQRKRFEGQTKNKQQGDEEAMENDWDYVEALEHGMPPATGTGIGIDRFAALITGSHTLREVTAFPIMKPAPQEINSNETKQVKNDVNEELPVTRDEALSLIKKYTKKEANLNHYLESEAVMRALARHLGRNEDYWGMLGLLHDIDWEITEHDSTQHLTKAPDLLREMKFDEDFINIILSHGYGFECAGLKDKKRTQELEHALACSETVTGLIYATALMRPEKINGLEVSSVKKKFKDKKFAANVSREVILECEKIGLTLDNFLQIAIDAMKKIAPKIGLI